MSAYREDGDDGRQNAMAFSVLHLAVFSLSILLSIALIFSLAFLPLAMPFMADSPRSDPHDIFHFVFLLKFLGILAAYGIIGSAIAFVIKVRLPVYVAALAYVGCLIWAIAWGVV